MSQTPGSFRPTELSGADRSPSDGELATAWSIARELEASLPPETVGPSPRFADAVMAAVAREPAPRRAGFLAALRARPGLAGFAASFREAWTVAVGGPGRPAGARGLALAYVLAVLVIGTSLTGVAAYGAAGALGFLDGDRSPTPSVETPSPEPSSSPEPSRTPDVSTSPEPSASAEPSESVEPSDSKSPEPTATAPRSSPKASPEASDDHGGSSPSPSAGDDSSPEPSRTPRPSDTPKPSESPG
jgi:hypothetical protein